MVLWLGLQSFLFCIESVASSWLSSKRSNKKATNWSTGSRKTP